MFGHRWTEIRGARVQDSRGEAQQSSCLQVPIFGSTLHLVSLRGHAILLHRALQPVELTVFQIRRAHQFDVIEHKISHFAMTHYARHVL